MSEIDFVQSPVLFMTFNRMKTTKIVLESIRKVKPSRLYIASDGARQWKRNETNVVKDVREYVLSQIDWKCEVKTLFSDEHAGCKYAIVKAISWFFDHEEMGIILEDDCVPAQSFFWFCEELLEKYKECDDVFAISGDGRATSCFPLEFSYGFIKYPITWGWATWKRVWEMYDDRISCWPQCGDDVVNMASSSRATQRFWRHQFLSVYNQRVDAWDFQFIYMMIKRNGKCIVPNKNLISNIGWGEGATHTLDSASVEANIPIEELEFPLSHDETVLLNPDLCTFYDCKFTMDRFIVRVINKISMMVLSRSLIQRKV